MDYGLEEIDFINTPIFEIVVDKYKGILELYLKRKKKRKRSISLTGFRKCATVALSMVF